MEHNNDFRVQEGLFTVSGSESPSAPPTVLCVDDDPNISEALSRRLQRLGIRVLRAFHGMQGCWLAATERPDVIVLDVAMPKGGGIEILQWLKRNAQTASIPVIVLTGKTDPGLSQKMQKLGAVRYLSKPLPFEVLLEELSQHIPVAAFDSTRRMMSQEPTTKYHETP